MSKRTIRIVDLYCDVANWNDSIRNIRTDDELKRWTKKRDKKLAQLRTNIAALSADEIDLIKRKYNPQQLAAQLRAVGAEPRW